MGAHSLPRRGAGDSRSAGRTNSGVIRHPAPPAIQNIRAGKDSRPHGPPPKKRSDALPDRAGDERVRCPATRADSFHGISAPNGTPREIVDKLNKEINARARPTPKLKARLAELGAEVVNRHAGKTTAAI